MHWTPVGVAVRAAEMLVDGPRARILDIGSGVGKFCIIAAAKGGAHVRGVEHRAHLIEIAERAAASVGVDVDFMEGTLASCDPRDVSGIYLFNPFEENICSNEDRIDETVELSGERFVRDVSAVVAFLRAARIGTRVVTYCGFGGALPSQYVTVSSGGPLQLSIKTRDGDE